MSDNEPIAWAVMLPDGDRIYDVYAIEEEAKAIDEAVTGNHGVVPLYRQPTLTDEERAAIGLARSVFEDYKMSRLHSAADEVLERLLERTK
jgi:hypothetical protein